MNTETCIFRCSQCSYSLVPKSNQLCCHLHKWIKAKELWCGVWINQLHVNMPCRKGLGESLQRSGIVLQGWIGNQKVVVTHITIKTCLWCQLIVIVSGCVRALFVSVWVWTVYVCSWVSVLAKKVQNPTPAISTLNCCQRLLIHIQRSPFPSNIYLHVHVTVLQVHCVWVSMFGTELFNCMPAHQCDFSRGQG